MSINSKVPANRHTSQASLRRRPLGPVPVVSAIIITVMLAAGGPRGGHFPSSFSQRPPIVLGFSSVPSLGG